MRGLGAALVVALVAGCSVLPPLPPPAGIQVTIPLSDSAKALPVTVVDHAGIVRAAAPGAPVNGESTDTSIQAIPGRDDAVRLAWIGGACDDRTIITVDRIDAGFTVGLETPSSAGVCPAVGIFRSVVLELTAPVGAGAFVLR